MIEQKICHDGMLVLMPASDIITTEGLTNGAILSSASGIKIDIVCDVDFAYKWSGFEKPPE